MMTVNSRHSNLISAFIFTRLLLSYALIVLYRSTNAASLMVVYYLIVQLLYNWSYQLFIANVLGENRS